MPNALHLLIIIFYSAYGISQWCKLTQMALTLKKKQGRSTQHTLVFFIIKFNGFPQGCLIFS